MDDTTMHAPVADVRYRLTTRDERLLREYLNDQGSITLQQLALGKDTGGAGTAPTDDGVSDGDLARVASYRRVERIRDAMWKDPAGVRRWGVLTLVMGIEPEPEPLLEEMYPGHPKRCKLTCSCVEDLEAHKRAARQGLEARRLDAIAPMTPLAYARGFAAATDSQSDALLRAGYAHMIDARRDVTLERDEREWRFWKSNPLMKDEEIEAYIRTLPRPDTTGLSMGDVATLLARAPAPVVPTTIILGHARNAIAEASVKAANEPRKQGVEREWLHGVRDEARELILDAEHAWVMARMDVHEQDDIERAAKKRAAEERARLRWEPVDQLADAVAAVAALHDFFQKRAADAAAAE